MDAKDLMTLQAETTTRLVNARQRGARGEVKWLTGVQEALRDLLDVLAAKSRHEADKKARAENVATAAATQRAFDGSDWMGQGEKSDMTPEEKTRWKQIAMTDPREMP